MPWTRSDWFDQVSGWVQTELEGEGITVSGLIEQRHAYPWSTVLGVPTNVGTIYFKAVSPLDPHEPVLLQFLARWHPRVCQKS
jgi:hypothetical protein